MKSHPEIKYESQFFDVLTGLDGIRKQSQRFWSFAWDKMTQPKLFGRRCLAQDLVLCLKIQAHNISTTTFPSHGSGSIDRSSMFSWTSTSDVGPSDTIANGKAEILEGRYFPDRQ